MKGAEPGEHCTQRLIHNLNIMDFSNSIIAMFQDNSEGLMRKNTIHIQRKNCESRITEEKQLLDHMSQWGYDLGCRL